MTTLSAPPRPAGFTPTAPLRLHAAEPILAAASQRATLLQLAHPGVAAGVAAYRQRTDAAEAGLAQLRSTSNAVLSIVWGDESDADRAFRALAAEYARPRNDDTDAASAEFGARGFFDVHDPVLVRWVWATLVDTTDQMLTRYVRPLTAARADALYADWRRLAETIGLPAALVPQTRADFADFFGAMLASPELTPDDTARRLAHDLLEPADAHVPSGTRGVPASFGLGLLPTALRDAYGLAWTPARQAAFARTDLLLRTCYHRLPASMRQTLPATWIEARRLAHRVTRDRPVIRWSIG